MLRIAAALVLIAACSRKPPAQQPSIATAGGRAQLLAFMQPAGQQGAPTPIDQQIAKLQRLLKAQPDKIDALVSLGDAWIRKARDTARPALYANAGACADLVLAKDPENKPALDLQGLVLMNDHRFEEARALTRSVVARWPEDPVAWGTLSDALLELGRTADSAEAAQKMMDLKPNLPSYSRAAHLQWLHGEIKAARESVRLAIDAGGDGEDLEPQAWVIVQAGMMFWNEGDGPGAEAGFELALQKLPGFPPALVGKARVLIGRGDGTAAAELLEKAYKASPLVETGWLLGDARELAGDAAGAQQAWAEVEKRGSAADPRTLALFLATKDRAHDEAAALALNERKVRDDQYTEDAIAWALYRQGKLEEALAASDKATALGTRDARLWFHKGAIELARGEAARGRRQIERALALNPHFDRSGEAEARKLLEAPRDRAGALPGRGRLPQATARGPGW